MKGFSLIELQAALFIFLLVLSSTAFLINGVLTKQAQKTDLASVLQIIEGNNLEAQKLGSDALRLLEKSQDPFGLGSDFLKEHSVHYALIPANHSELFCLLFTLEKENQNAIRWRLCTAKR